jgi:hypothetical protein
MTRTLSAALRVVRLMKLLKLSKLGIGADSSSNDWLP